jgi:hypothetical protein
MNHARVGRARIMHEKDVHESCTRRTCMINARVGRARIMQRWKRTSLCFRSFSRMVPVGIIRSFDGRIFVSSPSCWKNSHFSDRAQAADTGGWCETCSATNRNFRSTSTYLDVCRRAGVASSS